MINIDLIFEFLINRAHLLQIRAQQNQIRNHRVADNRMAVDFQHQKAAEIQAVLKQQVRLDFKQRDTLGCGQFTENISKGREK